MKRSAPRFLPCAKGTLHRAKPCFMSCEATRFMHRRCASLKNAHRVAMCFFLARPEGFEPPAFGIGIHCDIQLRHGRLCCKREVCSRSAYYCTPLFHSLQGVFYILTRFFLRCILSLLHFVLLFCPPQSETPPFSVKKAAFPVRSVSLDKVLAVGALLLRGVLLMGAHLNALQAAKIPALAMVGAIGHGTADVVIRMIHHKVSFRHFD